MGDWYGFGSEYGWKDRRTLCSEELAGDIEGFAADDDDLLAIEELFGDGAGETTEEVAFAVNDNLYGTVSMLHPRTSLSTPRKRRRMHVDG